MLAVRDFAAVVSICLGLSRSIVLCCTASCCAALLNSRKGVMAGLGFLDVWVEVEVDGWVTSLPGRWESLGAVEEL